MLEDREFQENAMLNLLISNYSPGQKGVKYFALKMLPLWLSVFQA